MKQGRVIFTGNFIEYCFWFVIFFILGFVTLGIFWAYLAYWSVKYFVSNLRIEIEE